MVSTGQFSLFLKKLFGFEKIDSFFFIVWFFVLKSLFLKKGNSGFFFFVF
jgi:hypothetical protein